MAPGPPRPVRVLGVNVHPLTAQQLNQALVELIETRAHAIVPNVNVHGLNLAFENAWLREFFNAAPLVFCDGAGVRLGAALLGETIPERITYADWIWTLAALAEARGYSVFFLGGRPGVADRAVQRLRTRHGGLRVAGVHDGYFDKREGSEANSRVLALLDAARPNLLVVGFGMPLQERWLLSNWPRIRADVALTAGGAFDIVSGEVWRGPRLLTAHGFEWLARLAVQPSKWRRYLIGNPLFLWRVLRERRGLRRRR